MIISTIAAISENNVIGIGNQLPWRLPSDLKYFRHTTVGNAVLMGRKTFDSIGYALPDRHNIILTHQRGLKIEGCFIVHSIQQAIDLAKELESEKLHIIGGEHIYRIGFPLSTRFYLTRVHAIVKGDVFFPWVFPKPNWVLVKGDYYPSDDKNQYAASRLVYELI